MSLPNVALYVVDTAVDSPSTGRVAWVSYDYLSPEMVQRPQWSADVLVHPLTADVYVVVLKSVVGKIFLWELVEHFLVAVALHAAFLLVLVPGRRKLWTLLVTPVCAVSVEMRDRVAQRSATRQFRSILKLVAKGATGCSLHSVSDRARPPMGSVHS